MIKHAAIAALAISVSLPAAAQSASDIASVKNGQDCRGCNLFQAELGYRDLPGINVSGSRLRQADMSLSTLNDAVLDNTDLSIANLFGARLTGASLRNANLQRATLVGTYLGGADLQGADLQGANLSGAELDTTKGLTQSQLNAACGDDLTRLPKGLRVPRCR